MTDDTTIQHKASHRTADGFGFEDGTLVPVVSPDSEPEPPAPPDGLDLEEVLSVFLSGSTSARETGERIECIAYRMPRVRGRAKTLRELSARLGCKHPEEARRICDKRGREFVKELKHLRREL